MRRETNIETTYPQVTKYEFTPQNITLQLKNILLIKENKNKIDKDHN